LGTTNSSLNFNQADTLSITSTISGAGTVNQAGTGTTVLTASNSYSGGTTIASNSTLVLGTGGNLSGTTNVAINGGTLLLEGNGEINPINTNASLSMSAGSTLSMSGPGATSRVLTQSFATLTLSGTTVIDFGNLSGISTLNISSILLSGNALSIYNWNGTTLWGTVSSTGGTGQLTHLLDSSALSGSDLSNITFYSGEDTGFLGTGTFSPSNPGEIIPVPEPSVMISGILLLGWMIWGARSQLKGLGLKKELSDHCLLPLLTFRPVFWREFPTLLFLGYRKIWVKSHGGDIPRSDVTRLI